VAWAVPLALDACDGLVAVTCNPPSGSSFNKGLTVVTCTASDSSGNTNSCVFTVTVLDTEAPVITNCPGVVTRYVVPGTASVPVEWAALMATDNCDGIVPVTCSPVSGSVFPLGTNLVTCLAADSSGNTNSCTFDVIVNETQRPLITGVNVAGTNVIVTFTTVSGGKYAIESNSQVWGTGWTEIESGIAGTGSFVSVTNASSSLSGSEFYRVKMLPP